MAHTPRHRAAAHHVINTYRLERFFLVFAIIYFPVSFLYLNRGFIAEALLTVYTVIMLVAAVMMLMKFCVWLARFANRHEGNFGDLWLIYLLDALFPLLMLKFFVSIAYQLLPPVHMGIWCEFKYFVINMLNLFSVQQNLSYAILGSLVLLFGFTVWSVRRN